MQIKLTVAEAARMFEIFRAEMDANPGLRAVENGNVVLDAVPSAPGAVHQMNGSLVEVWYKAANPATPRAIAEARRATVEFGLPRQLYSGRLIDIKRGSDGTVYFMVRAIQRDGAGFRCFNPSKGQLLEMTINPAAAQLVSGAQSPAPIQPAIQPQPAPVAAVPRGVTVRRSRRGGR
jgi:hypothetical protein